METDQKPKDNEDLEPYFEGKMKLKMHWQTREKLKADLKVMSSELSSSKKTLRKDMQMKTYSVSQQWHVLKAKREFRHMHLAYSMLRGRTLLQVEAKCHKDNALDLKMFREYLKDIKSLDELNHKKFPLA